MSQILNFEAQDIIFREGYPSDSAYVIIAGEVEIFHTRPDGTEERIALLKEGQMFGELGVLDDAPRSASARALTVLTLQEVPLSGY